MERDLRDSELYEMRFGFAERRNNVRFVAFLLAMVFAVALFGRCWANNVGFVRVSGSSMVQTLNDGDWLISYKVQDVRQIERGDVVVVEVWDIPEFQKENEGKAEQYQTKFLIKRVIALEGDIVRCTNGVMEICYAGTWSEQMSAAEYPFERVDESGYAYYDKEQGKYREECTFYYEIGVGEIFFLGDNRNNSLDSRYKEGRSHLDRLYKATDVTAIVPMAKTQSKLYNYVKTKMEQWKGK